MIDRALVVWVDTILVASQPDSVIDIHATSLDNVDIVVYKSTA